MADAVEALPHPETGVESGRSSPSPTASPEFEFWMVGRNPSAFPSPALLTADELFSGGVVLPLHTLQAAAPDGDGAVPEAEGDAEGAADDAEGAGDSARETPAELRPTMIIDASCLSTVNDLVDMFFEDSSSDDDDKIHLPLSAVPILEVPSLLEEVSSVVKRNTLKQKQENANQTGGCYQ